MPKTPFTHDDVQAAVDAAHAHALTVTGGKNADYIPALADVPADLCAVAAVTADGATVVAGDSAFAFSIQSISKVFTLALATEALGPRAIRTKIGASATGLPYDSAIALELHEGKPLSPLVNAGAIATVSLLPTKDRETRWNTILTAQSEFAGRPLSMSQTINASEQATNFHNRALAWLLYSAGTLECEPMETLDVYTRQCSTLITTADLATMGATLANGGKNPLTGRQVIKRAIVRNVLAQMMMEGFYIASGDFAYTVGLPGKSGVGGGILAVAPGKMALAAFAPPLNEAGNSVRGLAAIGHAAAALNLNLFAS